MAVQRLLLTPGEPAGIGPDLAVRVAQYAHDVEIVAIADPDLLRARAGALGLALRLESVCYDHPPRTRSAGTLIVDPLIAPARVEPGHPDPRNSAYVLAALDRAVALCCAEHADALVTGPVHKAVINHAGYRFNGHTGYLASRAASTPPVMMLTTDDGGLRVALATVHLPLAEVPAAIRGPELGHCLRVIHEQLMARFGIAKPRILVAGLNPHAGESGYLGREEIDIIAPAIKTARARGIDTIGPLAADTLFTAERIAGADAILAMYHDQGLPVIKHLGFARTVNVSLGLPFVRTSVDHGTALELAGTDRVHIGSLQAALNVAKEMAGVSRGA